MTQIQPENLAQPEAAAPLMEADVYAACRDFVLTYALPALEPENVIQGWQNRAALPAGSEEYAVISVISATQRGTTVETFRADDPSTTPPGLLYIQGLIEVYVQVEFCGDSDLARQRAQRCAVVARSSVGVELFTRYGMSILYADEVREHCFKGDAGQFVRRYATTLHVSLWSGDSVEMPYFNQASVSRLENVDAHHAEAIL